jgi:hypothetical protein
VNFFQPFKRTLKKERNNNMVRNNYNEPNKATFVGLVDEALDMALPKETSRMGFKLQEFGL